MEEANPEDDVGKESFSVVIKSSHPRPFLSIPYDIRLNIYKYLLVYSGQAAEGSLYLHESRRWKRQRGANMGYGISPGILSTCKIINEEATPILYGQNLIILPTYSSATTLKRHGGNLRHIRRLNLTRLDVFGYAQDRSRSSGWIVDLVEYLIKAVPKVTYLHLKVDPWHTRCEILPMLGRFEQLKQITLTGLYPRSWVAFIETCLNIAVVEEVEHRRRLSVINGKMSLLEKNKIVETLARYQDKVAQNAEFENPFEMKPKRVRGRCE